MELKIKKILFFLFSLFFLHSLTAQDSLPQNIQKIIKNGFTKKTPREVSSFIEAEIKKISSNAEKIIALSVLADYEERFDLFSRAGKHYLEAAELSPEAGKKTLLTKALGAFLLADNITDASELCSSRLLPSVNEPFSKDDIKILTFFEWLKLKSEEDAALTNIKKYVVDSRFKEFHPALLLSLWWVDGDKKAENTLLKKFPNSIEAGVVRGDTILSPKTFWYLMPRNIALKETDAEDEDKPIGKTQGTVQSQESQGNFSAKFYQTGFFKKENFAKGLSDELKKKGFTVLIKKEERGDETFFSVLVKDDGKGDMVIRLKSEGYEAVPIFD
ncbi:MULTISPECIES: hypothetical protein [unclassified Treponema]|uniref:hypothetical protein n=1 Tax=unclassified Treponema TaxID=2638727 RepID=UPI0020A34C2E|nr:MULTISPECIES: hypothetical protein [unclassified Treponema]UTC68043.1 hypothetical protein E4O06_05215 [Treponema sp. OMZ 789]UTC70765.1 hypothetical protein E4O01_05360 [Treponema sp. OMZ 790]UTC73485.1 hypothetical protein E4O02_05450 [Treponema sp. OMZ 791]UTC73505.1 hypothetical protein E4O02_05555 [Treponema sp. OMZ 791]